MLYNSGPFVAFAYFYKNFQTGNMIMPHGMLQKLACLSILETVKHSSDEIILVFFLVKCIGYLCFKIFPNRLL